MMQLRTLNLQKSFAWGLCQFLNALIKQNKNISFHFKHGSRNSKQVRKPKLL